jgi:hypothetical protein
LTLKCVPCKKESKLKIQQIKFLRAVAEFSRKYIRNNILRSQIWKTSIMEDTEKHNGKTIYYKWIKQDTETQHRPTRRRDVRGPKYRCGQASFQSGNRSWMPTLCQYRRRSSKTYDTQAIN